MRGADLRKAQLRGAILAGTDLRGADLSDATGLTMSQLEKVVTDDATRLPAPLQALARETPRAGVR